MRSTLISALADGLFRLMQSHIERVLFDGPAIHKRIDEWLRKSRPIIPGAT